MRPDLKGICVVFFTESSAVFNRQWCRFGQTAVSLWPDRDVVRFGQTAVSFWTDSGVVGTRSGEVLDRQLCHF
jgi:hypothetical protein